MATPSPRAPNGGTSECGREPPDGIANVVLPDSADGISALSWLEMRALAIRLLAEPQTSDADKTVTNAPPVAATGGTTTL